MQPIRDTVTAVFLVTAEKYKEHLLLQDFTPERSWIVDQIDFIHDNVNSGLPFAEAVRGLQG